MVSSSLRTTYALTRRGHLRITRWNYNIIIKHWKEEETKEKI